MTEYASFMAQILTSSNHIMGNMMSGNEATCLMSLTWLTARFICTRARALSAVPIIGCTSMYNACFSSSGGDMPITASRNAGSAVKIPRKNVVVSNYAWRSNF